MGWSTLIGGVSHLVFEPIRHPVPRSKPELMDLILDIRYQAILHLIGCLLEPKKFASIFTIGTRSVFYIRFSVTADFGYKGPRQLNPKKLRTFWTNRPENRPPWVKSTLYPKSIVYPSLSHIINIFIHIQGPITSFEVLSLGALQHTTIIHKTKTHYDKNINTTVNGPVVDKNCSRFFCFDSTSELHCAYCGLVYCRGLWFPSDSV